MTKSPSADIHALLSISIDVCGSTAAKAQIRSFQEKFGRHAEQFTAYLRIFCAIERDFYLALARGKVARLQDLFVVKHIGDEIWCVMPLMLEEVERSRKIINDVLVALSDVLTRHCNSQFTITDTPDDPWRENWEDDEWASIALGVKVTVDLLQDFSDFTQFRFHQLAPRVLTGIDIGSDPSGQAEVLQSLNFGTTEVNGTRVKTAVRSDYVGLDVDRFFRLTQRAMPGLLLVGDDLCTFMQPHVQPVEGEQWEKFFYMLAHEDRAFFDQYPRASTSGGRSEQWRSLLRKEEVFKGLAQQYGYRYLLGGYNNTLPQQAFIEGYQGLYAGTAKLLREAGAMNPPLSRDDIGRTSEQYD